MASDFVFRKATFGGFNRDDVIEYIEQLKSWELSLTEEISQKDEKLKAAQEKILANDEIVASKDSEIDDLKEKIAELEDKLEQSQLEIQNVHIECEDKISQLISKHNEENEQIRTEISHDFSSDDADRTVEARVGSAMLDVRRYADLLLTETCGKISKMSDDADTAAAKTLTRVLDISSGIQTFSDKLNDILRDILNENEELCRELTGFKGTLKLPFEEASGKLEADVFGE